jgi:hypothetical protein
MFSTGAVTHPVDYLTLRRVFVLILLRSTNLTSVADDVGLRQTRGILTQDRFQGFIKNSQSKFP